MFSLSREHHPFSPVSVGGNWHWSPMRIACWHPRAIGTCRMFWSGFFLSQTVEVTRFTAGYWHDMYANTQFEIEFTLPKISMQLMLTIAVKRQGLQFLQLAYTHPRWPLENAPGQVEECCRNFFKIAWWQDTKHTGFCRLQNQKDVNKDICINTLAS